MIHKYTCPHCGLSYDSKDTLEADSFKACYLLNKHGLSMRAIGRLMQLKPQSVKWRIDKYQERITKQGETNEKEG